MYFMLLKKTSGKKGYCLCGISFFAAARQQFITDNAGIIRHGHKIAERYGAYNRVRFCYVKKIIPHIVPSRKALNSMLAKVA